MRPIELTAAFFSDPKICRINDRLKLFLIGLYTLADSRRCVRIDYVLGPTRKLVLTSSAKVVRDAIDTLIDLCLVQYVQANGEGEEDYLTLLQFDGIAVSGPSIGSPHAN
jgi:hypothetical protein